MKKLQTKKPYLILFIPSLILGVLLITSWIKAQHLTKPWSVFASKFQGNDYRTESVPLDDKQVFIVQQKTALDLESPAKKPPLVWLQDTNDIYEIIFTGEYGDTGIWENEFKTIDIDGDKKEELITEWNLNWGGSGGFKGLVVWKYENGSITPIIGYPEDFESDRKIQVKTLDGKVLAEYPVTNLNYMARVNPGGKFYFGSFIYDIQNESHTGPHFWKLKAYKYQKDKFVIDESWNNGEEITTNEKYALSDDLTLFMDLYPYFKQ